MTTEQQPEGEIVAKAGTYYRNARYLITLACIGLGLYFLYDGFVGYPRENQELARIESELEKARHAGDEAKIEKLNAEKKDLKHHSDTDIRWQKNLGFFLPPLGIVLLARWIYISRGRYRLSGDTLHAPGHPPVRIDEIKDIDKSRWQRKGIAFLNYETQGKTGSIKLDDFVYQRQPIDAILQRIENTLHPPRAEEEASTAG